MSLLSEIQSLKRHHISLGLMTFVGVVAPGFLMIFHFRPALVVQCDAIKLLLLSVALTLPVIVLNYFLAWFSAPHLWHKKGTSDIELVLFLSLLGAVPTLYGALFSAYLFHLTFRQMLVPLILVNIPVFLFTRYCLSGEEPQPANKAPEPTTTAVTSPAAQEPRQP
jgi:hypothetical protein